MRPKNSHPLSSESGENSITQGNAQWEEFLKKANSAKGNSKSPCAKIKLPEHVCSLDIETADAPKDVTESTLAVAGTNCYSLTNTGKYISKGYKFYMINDLTKLESFLNNFAGIIIGHNIFNFDYVVLNKHINLKKIISKTVDTRLVAILKRTWDRISNDFDPSLFNITLSRSEFNLKSLSVFNFRIGKLKLEESKSIPRLWQKGNKRQVLKHNKRDCQLTMDIWLDFIKQKKISTKWHEYELDDNELQVLTGQIPYLSFSDWKKRLSILNSPLKTEIEMDRAIGDFIFANYLRKKNNLQPLEFYDTQECLYALYRDYDDFRIPNHNFELWYKNIMRFKKFLEDRETKPETAAFFDKDSFIKLIKMLPISDLKKHRFIYSFKCKKCGGDSPKQIDYSELLTNWRKLKKCSHSQRPPICQEKFGLARRRKILKACSTIPICRERFGFARVNVKFNNEFMSRDINIIFEHRADSLSDSEKIQFNAEKEALFEKCISAKQEF